ncbi:MAG: hypothetical protein P9L92_17830 [Candidatus Electryonea clarkiae]|nr:hypothetical protein [Candidatus Electryonea clarkiae]MDP8287760.1 hypothetical protein [Candidatus Electryonea clarkiae]
MTDKSLSTGKILGGILVLLLLTVVMIAGYVESRNADEERVHYNQILKPPSAELIQQRVQESELLNSYAILDEENQIYRIPVKKAMELISNDSSKSRP